MTGLDALGEKNRYALNKENLPDEFISLLQVNESFEP